MWQGAFIYSLHLTYFAFFFQAFPLSATTLHFEFYSEAPSNLGNAREKKLRQSVISVIHMDHVDQRGKSSAEIMEDLLASYNVPEDKQVSFVLRIFKK